MDVTVRRAAIIAALLLVAVAAFAYGTSDISVTDAGSAGSVIWD